MTPTEQQMIDDLFSRVKQAEDQATASQQAPEPEALSHIFKRLQESPNAAYYMAQALVVQDEALKGLAARVEDLEAQLAETQRQAPAQGGFLSSLFGGAPRAPQQRRPMSQSSRSMGGGSAGIGGASPWGGASSAQGRHGQAFSQAPRGSFLAGAMQTAVGVAGGVLLGNAVASMFSDGAQAAEAGVDGLAGDAAPDMGQDFAADSGADQMIDGGPDVGADDGGLFGGFANFGGDDEFF